MIKLLNNKDSKMNEIMPLEKNKKELSKNFFIDNNRKFWKQKKN